MTEIETDKLLTLVPGRRVVISACEGSDHGDSPGCLCALIGTVQVMGTQRETIFVATPSWKLEGMNKFARLSEVTFLREDNPHG